MNSCPVKSGRLDLNLGQLSPIPAQFLLRSHGPLHFCNGVARVRPAHVGSSASARMQNIAATGRRSNFLWEARPKDSASRRLQSSSRVTRRTAQREPGAVPQLHEASRRVFDDQSLHHLINGQSEAVSASPKHFTQGPAGKAPNGLPDRCARDRSRCISAWVGMTREPGATT
jgi:hypothetical protein